MFCTRPKNVFSLNRMSSQESPSRSNKIWLNFSQSSTFLSSSIDSKGQTAFQMLWMHQQCREKTWLLSSNKSLWIYLHQLMETTVISHLHDNLFSRLSLASSLTDDNKTQWNYLWALTCTSAHTFLVTWFFLHNLSTFKKYLFPF